MGRYKAVPQERFEATVGINVLFNRRYNHLDSELKINHKVYYKPNYQNVSLQYSLKVSC